MHMLLATIYTIYFIFIYLFIYYYNFFEEAYLFCETREHFWIHHLKMIQAQDINFSLH